MDIWEPLLGIAGWRVTRGSGRRRRQRSRSPGEGVVSDESVGVRLLVDIHVSSAQDAEHISSAAMVWCSSSSRSPWADWHGG
jgi:hypothetical protein